MMIFTFLENQLSRKTFITLILLCMPLSMFGAYSRVNGTWSPDRYAPMYSVQEHYDQATQNLNSKNWDEAFKDCMVIIYHYPESPFYPDALFYSGVCYIHKKDYDLANRQFNKYLDLSGKLKHFEEVFEYKFEIAENFKEGSRKHLFGKEKLPKLAPARGDALLIYDEIIAALPGRDLSAKALFSKADFLRRTREFQDCIDALQMITRRFPKHPLAVESYLKISEVYLQQSRLESQNPDLIALAQVNLQRFHKSFAGEERVQEAEENLFMMRQVYAQSLYDIGRFYERKRRPQASIIYYQDAIRKYPESPGAQKSHQRLARLGVRPALLNTAIAEK